MFYITVFTGSEASYRARMTKTVPFILSVDHYNSKNLETCPSTSEISGFEKGQLI